MRFFEVVLSGAALISTVWAVTIDQYPSALVAGEKVTLTYSPKDAPATFVLRKGVSTNLDTIATIGTATGGSFEWTVPTDLVDGSDYAFEIKQGDENNYSAQIPLTGGSGSSSSASSSAGYPTMTPSLSSVIASSAASSSAYSTETIVIPSSSVVLTTSAALPIASASGTGAMTMPGMNSTITTATLSTSGSSPSSTDSSPPVEQTGAAAMFGSSPLALLVGAAAMAYLN